MIGAKASWSTTVVLGIATVLCTSVATGISEYFSTKAHKHFLDFNRRREMWEFKNFRDGEINLLISKFEDRGMIKKDAESIVTKIAQYENIFVSLMVTEELGLQPSDDHHEEINGIVDSLVIVIAFAFFGLMPVVVFGAASFNGIEIGYAFFIEYMISIIALGILALIKSSFSSATYFHAVMEFVLLSFVCIGAGYGLSAIASSCFNP